MVRNVIVTTIPIQQFFFVIGKISNGEENNTFNYIDPHNLGLV